MHSDRINQKDVFGWIADLGKKNFDMAITEAMLTPSHNYEDPGHVLVSDDEGNSLNRDDVLRLVHNAFVKLRIEVPPFESEPFSALLEVHEFTMLLSVRNGKLVHVRTFHNLYIWGESPE